MRAEAARRQPRGVHLDLRNADACRAAFPEALKQSRNRDVVVESYITGNDYRCLVIGGKVAAIAERVPAWVVADAEHTVASSSEIANADPRRGIGHERCSRGSGLDAAAEGSSVPRASGSTTSRPSTRVSSR